MKMVRSRRFILGSVLLAAGVSIAAVAAAQTEKVTLSIWGSHSEFVLSADETQLLFSENGPDFLVLKAADLDTGLVSTLRTVPCGSECHFASIPGDSSRILADAPFSSGRWPYQVWILSLRGADDLKLDVGELGSDGTLLVSPSGKYVAIGTEFDCFGSRDNCFAQSLSVFSTSSGERLFSLPVSTPEKGPLPTGGDLKQGQSTGRASQRKSVGWATDDVLVLTFHDREPRAFFRAHSGKWRERRPVPSSVRPAEVQEPYTPSVDLMTVTGARLGSVALSSKFGPEPGRIRVLRGTRRVVLFKDAPRKNECVITAYSYPAITAIERLNAPLKTLPRGVRLSEPEVLRLLIPDYESKVLRNTFEADGSIDPLTLYRASIFNARRTNLGLPGRDLLVVLIHEVDTECTACHASILGVVDLSSRRVLGTYKQEGLPITLALTKTSSGPWPILFTSWMGNRAGAELHRQATPRITATGDLTFEYSDAQELTRQE